MSFAPSQINKSCRNSISQHEHFESCAEESCGENWPKETAEHILFLCVLVIFRRDVYLYAEEVVRNQSLIPYRSGSVGDASTKEDTESITAGQGTGGGKRALYHCNYCNKDITGRIHIKCAECSDFDLCIECFSVGAEVYPHKSSHPYRVMDVDVLSFPLISPEWNAEEEILLLEGIEMFGMGNWAEVAVHVGTKTKEACIDHYKKTYLYSPSFPLLDMTHLAGKDRKELLDLAKRHLEDRRGKLGLKEKSPLSPSKVKVEDLYEMSPSGGSPLTSTAERTSGRTLRRNKSEKTNEEAPSLAVLSGYNPKRHEYEIEYDNDAEQLLVDMEFNETDDKWERELKLRVLHVYSRRIDERNRRKDFILERDLLHPRPYEKDLSQEEKDICRRYRPFMRLHTKEEHDELLRTAIEEHRTLKSIQQLKEARAAGCRTRAEADRYLELKRRKAEESSLCNKNSQASPSSQDRRSAPLPSDSFGTYSNMNADQASASSETDTDSVSKSAVDLLSESEIQLCHEIRLTPSQYLKMQEDISIQIFKGNVTKKSDAHSLFPIEHTKIDRVYDMLTRKGIAPQ